MLMRGSVYCSKVMYRGMEKHNQNKVAKISAPEICHPNLWAPNGEMSDEILINYWTQVTNLREKTDPEHFKHFSYQMGF